MTVKLVVDLADPYGPEVRVGGLTFKEQWVEFYALLAMVRTDESRREEFVDAQRLHSMPLWGGNKQLASVGKEVARHCSRLEGEALDLIDSKRKTKLWRLTIGPDAIEFRPSRASVERWLHARMRTSDIDGRWIEQLEGLARAHIALHTGEGARAREILRDMDDFVSPELEAWAGLVDARGTDQYVDPASNPEALDTLADHWSERSDVAGRSVAARITARVALRKRFSAPAEQHSLLNRYATELERRGDITALAAVLNVLGILATRLERPGEAAHHHLRAAALFGIAGDVNSLQGAVFNAANARVRARQLDGDTPDELSLRLLDVCGEVCRTFAVGKDAIQSEISGAHWAMDMGNYAAARRYLDAGTRVVGKLDSAFEQGCYLFARARLELLDPGGRFDPLRDLRAARREFAHAGADGPLADVEQMITRIEELEE